MQNEGIQNNKLLNEALENPFIQAIRKEVEGKKENFWEFLCWRGQIDSGIKCDCTDHTYEEIECKRQISAILSLHLQSKHISQEKLDEMIGLITGKSIKSDIKNKNEED